MIKSGFQGTEGPIGMPDGTLIFTETQANRITRIAADGTTSTFLENTNGSNGLAFDAKGRLISVQTTPGQTKIGVIYPKGAEAVLSDNFDGKGYGRPNDLVVSTRGGIYFTEPGPNVTPGAPPPATPPLPPAVYFIPPGGKAMKVADGIERPNGIMLSRDEKTLYVNNTNGEYLLAFDVKPDGTLGQRAATSRSTRAGRRTTATSSSAAPTAWPSTTRDASMPPRQPAWRCSTRRARISARFRCRARRRTSRLPARTRKRSTSSVAARHSRSICKRRASRAGRSRNLETQEPRNRETSRSVARPTKTASGRERCCEARC